MHEVVDWRNVWAHQSARLAPATVDRAVEAMARLVRLFDRAAHAELSKLSRRSGQPGTRREPEHGPDTASQATAEARLTLKQAERTEKAQGEASQPARSAAERTRVSRPATSAARTERADGPATESQPRRCRPHSDRVAQAFRQRFRTAKSCNGYIHSLKVDDWWLREREESGSIRREDRQAIRLFERGEADDRTALDDDIPF